MFNSKFDLNASRVVQPNLSGSTQRGSSSDPRNYRILRHFLLSVLLIAALLVGGISSSGVASALQTPEIQVSPASLEFDLAPGMTATQSITISNLGQTQQSFRIGEQSVPADTSGVGNGRILVFMDTLPYGSDALLEILQANNIPYDAYESSSMSTVDFSMYEAVFLAGDQPEEFFEQYNANYERFESYVRNGGFLWVNTVWGLMGRFTDSQLPGGTTIASEGVAETYNILNDPDHPVVEGVDYQFFGTLASAPWFIDLYPGTHVIAIGQITGMPSLIEYDYGAGRVLGLAQFLEWGYEHGEDAGIILRNSVPYAYAFEPFVDVPWLSEDLVTGTVMPGATQEIQVSVDTTGLAVGVYQAVLILVTEDPGQPSIEIPVTLRVGMYSWAVNVGGGAYTDLAGNVWEADQPYSPGSWGYVGASKTMTTKRAISGTEDDPLYQSQRLGMDEYRFDGLAPGTYQVELYFAELKKTKPGRHHFDIQLENAWFIPSHDIAAEVGSFAADYHTFLVPVNDGTLNIVFTIHKGAGVPVLNAIRITQQP